MKAKSLTFRIFINTFLTGSLIYFLCTLIFIGTVYKYFEKQIFNGLETESQFLIYPILSGNLEEIKNIETSADTVIFDGIISQRLVDVASLKGIKRLVAFRSMNIVKKPDNLKIITMD